MATKKRYRDPDLSRHGSVDDITGWRHADDPGLPGRASADDARAVLAFSIDGVLVPIDQNKPETTRRTS